MKIVLTQEQIEQLKTDTYLEIDMSNGARMYFEFDGDGTFSYGEIYNQKDEVGRRNGFYFDSNDLERLISKRPNDPSFYHNDPLCPNCGTYMIYQFECCPKCGQRIDWRAE